MRLVISGLLVFSLLSQCSEPSYSEITNTLKRTEYSISHKSLQKAEEDIRQFTDDWNYYRSHYKKKDAKKIDQLIEEIEMSLAISNYDKAKKDWNKLYKKWQQINE